MSPIPKPANMIATDSISQHSPPLWRSQSPDCTHLVSITHALLHKNIRNTKMELCLTYQAFVMLRLLLCSYAIVILSSSHYSGYCLFQVLISLFLCSSCGLMIAWTPVCLLLPNFPYNLKIIFFRCICQRDHSKHLVWHNKIGLRFRLRLLKVGWKHLLHWAAWGQYLVSGFKPMTFWSRGRLLNR